MMRIGVPRKYMRAKTSPPPRDSRADQQTRLSLVTVERGAGAAQLPTTPSVRRRGNRAGFASAVGGLRHRTKVGRRKRIHDLGVHEWNCCTKAQPS
jgi:hypothetical protein